MMPNPVNGVNLHDPRMDPLWAEAERLGVPICFIRAEQLLTPTS
jgi:predicted TIM-barrel fold metal-dependent hydrolase